MRTNPRRFVGVIVATLGVVRSAPADELLDRARASHVASLAAIASIRAQVALEVTLLDDAVLPSSVEANRAAHAKRQVSGEFVRSGDRIRITEQLGQKRTIIKDLRAGTSHLMPQTPHPGGRIARVTGTLRDFASNLDICDGIVFCLPRPVPPDYDAYPTLDRAIARATSVSARSEQLDGADTVRIDLEMGEDISIRVWLAPEANYLFKRILVHRGGKPSVEIHLSEFIEVKPGVYCPTRAERTVFRATKWVTTLSDIRVNEKIDARLFDTRLPAGAFDTNLIDGKVSAVGSSGQPEKTVGHLISSESSTESSPAAPLAATPLNADEPRVWSWSRILLVASVALGVAGIVIRSRRATQVATPKT